MSGLQDVAININSNKTKLSTRFISSFNINKSTKITKKLKKKKLNKSFFGRRLKYVVQFDPRVAEFLSTGTVGTACRPFAPGYVNEHHQANN